MPFRGGEPRSGRESRTPPHFGRPDPLPPAATVPLFKGDTLTVPKKKTLVLCPTSRANPDLVASTSCRRPNTNSNRTFREKYSRHSLHSNGRPVRPGPANLG